MNESDPAIIAPIEAAAAPAHKDRSTGLAIFGILTTLLGCLAGLFALLMLAQLSIPRPAGAPPVNTASLLMVVPIYGTLAGALIWLGVGSVMAKRWARALLLIFSWSWLVTGVFITAIMPFIMGKVFANLPPNAKTGQPVLPPAAITAMIVFMVIFFGVFFVLAPALWVYFYKSPHVKATCETRDPVPRWTDACPLPVLGFSLWTWLAVPMMLAGPLTGRAVMPFFGMFVSGLPGAAFCLVIAAIWGLAGWWLYRLDARGWWLILIALVVFMVSGLLTYANHDIIELYQLQGIPQAEIDQIQKIGLFTGKRMGWMTVLMTVPFLGYLLFIKKYLRQA